MTAEYREGLGYDENIMPKYHKRMGYSTYVFSCFSEDGIYKDVINDDGVCVKWFKRKYDCLLGRLGRFEGLYEEIYKLAPDIIYVHNAQFIDFFNIVKYVKKNGRCRLYVDNHDDYYNCPINNIKKRILHCLVYRMIMLYSLKYVRVFWGVTPWRCIFLNEVYGIPTKRIKLLVMGADDDYVRTLDRNETKADVRRKYGLSEKDFVLISGGRIDKEKSIHMLVDTVAKDSSLKIKLLLFGSIDDEVRDLIYKNLDGRKIQYIGWQDTSEIYRLFIASDLAVFPGTHSILWEQACACGIPILVKKWNSMQHIDLGGNAFFIDEVDEKRIGESLHYIIDNKKVFERAQTVATEKCVEYFSYSRIAREAIEET